ncbi:hypothetical protein BEN47_13625 [Hymenobacter lapidarius]|uniref:Uncharacterized protein n=1 Tax=Hymenobacter lapidarius TaxID=1908237 RepID=A0A1G1T562_9BACT|nr:hypothetical protein [Hymenobacter lapidarius]OGX86012.1 hypothetical protein BEN47_13625 [Hymenobacter lapidarius]
MKLCLFLGLAALLATSACKKDDFDLDGLVPATQSGKDTGDFLLNGQPYRPGRGSAYPGPAVGAIWSNIRGGRKITVVMGRKFDRDDTGINIVLPRITGPAVFTITDGVSPVVITGNRSYIIYGITQPSPARQFLTGPAAVGRVEVTRYDTVARVVSGTFEAMLREFQGPDSVVITKGRFDCKF